MRIAPSPSRFTDRSSASAGPDSVVLVPELSIRNGRTAISLASAATTPSNAPPAALNTLCSGHSQMASIVTAATTRTAPALNKLRELATKRAADPLRASAAAGTGSPAAVGLAAGTAMGPDGSDLIRSTSSSVESRGSTSSS